MERFFIYCPAPPFMNVAMPEKWREGIYVFSDKMALMSSRLTTAKCALDRFFIYCPALLFMNVDIAEKCREGICIHF